MCFYLDTSRNNMITLLKSMWPFATMDGIIIREYVYRCNDPHQVSSRICTEQHPVLHLSLLATVELYQTVSERDSTLLQLPIPLDLPPIIVSAVTLRFLPWWRYGMEALSALHRPFVRGFLRGKTDYVRFYHCPVCNCPQNRVHFYNLCR